MAVEKMTENVEVVQTLSTYPNQEEGLSAEQLKAKFDQGPKALKEYLNNVLVPAVQAIQNAMDAGEQYGLDTTLSVPGRAADAGAVGTALASKAPAGYGFGEPLLVGGRTIFAFEGESIEAYCAKIDEALSTMTDYTSKMVLARCVNSLGDFYSSSGNCQAVLYRGAGEGNASLVTIGAPYDWEIRKINGVWQQPEWVNPPLVLGVEYRTTKRYQGKSVYTACFSCGNLPVSGTTETPWYPPDGSTVHIINHDVTYGNNQGSVNGLGYKAYSHNYNEIRITNEGGGDWSGFTATALIEYWKE